MAREKHALSSLLKKKKFPVLKDDSAEEQIKDLQLKMLRIQQGVWHAKKRAIILFEGFDAGGKGGAIRVLTNGLDPRGVHVHPIGPPRASEQGRHYLYRFWRALPEPGSIAIFDRSWYGRVLIERVNKITPKARWKAAYDEINEFENMLTDDGIDLVKVFLVIHPEEQLRRFEARLRDPYKQWKLNKDDLEARGKWNQYVRAGDDLVFETNKPAHPWNVIPGDSKDYARIEVLKTVTDRLAHHGAWIKKVVSREKETEHLRKLLKQLKKVK